MGKSKHISEAELPQLPWDGWPTVDDPIELCESEAVASINNQEMPGTAACLYTLAPSPHVIGDFSTDVPMLGIGGEDVTIRLKEQGFSVGGFWVNLRSHVQKKKKGRASTDIRFVVTEVTEPERTRASKVVLLIINLPAFSSSQDIKCKYDDGNGRTGSARIGHLVLSYRNWQLELTARIDISQAISEAKVTGYAATYVGELSRSDGEIFSCDEAEDALSFFHHFLSFACGGWCGLHLPTGKRKDQIITFRLWGNQQRTTEFSQCLPTWWDEKKGDILLELLPLFENLWISELWHKPLKDAIYWYVLANSLPNADASLILVHSALDLLSWVYLVKSGKSLSKKKFKDKSSAAGRFEILFKRLEIPNNKAPGLKELNDTFKNTEKERNLTQAFSEVRNDIVHPDSSKIKEECRTEAIRIASELGLWCFELSLLSIMGYPGKYHNRLKHQWSGEVEAVPWAESGKS